MSPNGDHGDAEKTAEDDVYGRKIAELEAKLIEHEHRSYRVLYNFFVERPFWPQGDARRRAALGALLWKFFARTPAATVLIASGGVIAVLGALLALQANLLLAKQNRMISIQTALEESSRRSALVFELSAILDQIDDEITAAERRSKSAPKPPSIQMLRDGAQTEVKLTERTYGRIIALSRSLRPYRYLDKETRKTTRRHNRGPSWTSAIAAWLRDLAGRVFQTIAPGLADTQYLKGVRLTPLLSPERAQLIISLFSSGIAMSPDIRSKMDLSFADLDGASLGGINLQSANLYRSSFRGTNLANANLSASNVTGLKVFGLRVTSVKILTRLNRANLAQAYLFAADLSGAMLVRANLTGADLNHADLDEATLTRARLRNAVLTNADLRGASLDRANLTKANLSQANLSAANLKNAKVTQEQIATACVAENTVLPRNLTRPTLSSGCIEVWGEDLGRELSEMPPSLFKDSSD